MKRHALYTTGYAGHDTKSFIAKLDQNNVQVVVDVRRNPVSRKQGFSRTKLSSALCNAKLEYIHLRDLGVPNDLRAELRSGQICLTDYLLQFDQYLETQGVALDRLYAMATQGSCCLLCVEHLPEECHRSVVATAVARRNGRRVEIVHI